MKKDNKLPVSIKIIFVFVLLTIIIPIIINQLLFLPYPATPSDIGNKDWLTFWGSFIGGSIGGIATLFAVYYTLRQNLEHNQNNLDVQMKQSRLGIIPYIDVRLFIDKPMGNPVYFMFKDLFKGEDKPTEKEVKEETIIQFPSGYVLFKKDNVSYSNILDKQYKTILEQGGIAQRQEGGVITFYDSRIKMVGISLNNIGMSSAVNVTLELNNNTFTNYAIMPTFNFKVDELIVLNLVFDREFPEGENTFKIKFYDLQGNSYIQQFNVRIKDKDNYLESITSPELENTFEV